jgi:[acyl-carrier-protein] S-malonyltransferase
MPVNDRTAVLFPGQGSQTDDMRDSAARLRPDLVARATEIVGEDPFARVEDGTRFQQPALFCASLAGYGTLDVQPDAAAGHSLGEFGALAAAGALDETDALELVALRGELMDAAACEGPPAGMLAVLKGKPGDAEAIATDLGLTVANDNAPGQVVLSGERGALEEAEEAAREYNVRARPLDVAGAFHSPRMEPAVAPFREALDKVEISDPRFPVYCGATAAPFTDVRGELAEALIRPVRWRETFLALLEAGAEDFVETGPGTVLSKMARRITKETANA